MVQPHFSALRQGCPENGRVSWDRRGNSSRLCPRWCIVGDPRSLAGTAGREGGRNPLFGSRHPSVGRPRGRARLEAGSENKLCAENQGDVPSAHLSKDSPFNGTSL
jgi:hypothetical protein